MIRRSCFLITAFLAVYFSQQVYAVIIPTEKIREIVEYEGDLISALGNYIQEENEKEHEIDEAIHSFHQMAQEENLSFLLNPVDIFRLHRRAVDAWDQVIQKVLCEDCARNNGSDDMEIALYRSQRRSMWPREADVPDAAMALVRVCRVYNLSLDDVIRGRLGDMTTATLTFEDILFIADTALDNGFLYETVHWLLAAIAKAKQSKEPEALVVKLYRELAGAYFQASKPLQSLKYIQECAALYPDSKSVKRDLHYYKQTKRDSSSKGDNSELTPHLPTRTLAACERLCRGEGKKSANRHLVCRIRRIGSSFMVVKEEIVSWRPRIVIMHQLLNQQEIEYFENISPDKVQRSGYMSWTQRKDVFNKEKGLDEDQAIRAELAQKIVNVTGFHAKHPIRAKNVGLGEPMEVIRLIPPLVTYPDNVYSMWFYEFPIARWMYFLTDTTGGEIVFPDLNLRIPPVKGSAMYWYKLKPNGEPEMRSRFCTCPTLLGSPWVLWSDLSVPTKLDRTFCGLTRTSAYPA